MLLYEADAPRIQRLRRIGAVQRIGEKRRVSRQCRLPSAGFDVERRDLERGGLRRRDGRICEQGTAHDRAARSSSSGHEHLAKTGCRVTLRDLQVRFRRRTACAPRKSSVFATLNCSGES